jgi:hypothetical protein
MQKGFGIAGGYKCYSPAGGGGDASRDGGKGSKKKREKGKEKR